MHVKRVGVRSAEPEPGRPPTPPPPPPPAISASSHRPFTACGETVLRYREGTSTRQQYCRHHDAFEEGHVVSPTRRRTHLTRNVVCDTRAVIPPISTLRLCLSRLPRRRRSY